MDLHQLKSRIEPLRKELLAHPVYSEIASIEDLCAFTEEHVFAVWDFMSLLKTLQQHLTCVQVPWYPTKNAETRRFINEIVVGEESDVDAAGDTMSHFEMYVQAMQTMGADTHEIEQFIQRISANTPLDEALDSCAINAETKDFVRFTFSIIQRGKIHEIASLFTLGREDLIPEMFIEMVKELKANHPTQMADFLYYLERHIEVDGEDHGPLSLKLMDEVCENDPVKWEEATLVAEQALKMRMHLWNGVRNKILLRSEVRV
mgnify:CR=1 FL=1